MRRRHHWEFDGPLTGREHYRALCPRCGNTQAVRMGTPLTFLDRAGCTGLPWPTLRRALIAALWRTDGQRRCR